MLRGGRSGAVATLHHATEPWVREFLRFRESVVFLFWWSVLGFLFS